MNLAVIMAIYLPFSVYFYILYPSQLLLQNSEPNIYSNVSLLVCITFHFISIWLTVYLSVYRYLYMNESVALIGSNNNRPPYQQSKTTKFILMNSSQTILIICVFSFLFCFPTYFYSVANQEVILNRNFSLEQNLNNQSDVYLLTERTYLNMKTNNLVLKINFYLQSLLGKILPSVSLFIFTILTLNQLTSIKNNKAKLIKISFSVSKYFFICI